MENYDEIYKRIHERKQINQDKEIRNEKPKKGSVLKIFNRLLGIVSLILAFLIYAYKDPSASFVNKIFHTNLNFTSFNQKIVNLSNNLTSFFNFASKNKTTTNDIPVSSNSKFIKVSDYYYTNDEHTAYPFSSGTVLSIENEKGYKIMIRHDNGYIGIYDELDTCLVKDYDRIDVNTKLGYFEKEFGLYFIKDKITYTYEDIIKN